MQKYEHWRKIIESPAIDKWLGLGTQMQYIRLIMVCKIGCQMQYTVPFYGVTVR